MPLHRSWPLQREFPAARAAWRCPDDGRQGNPRVWRTSGHTSVSSLSSREQSVAPATTTHHSHTTTHTYNNTHTSVSSLSSREQSVAPATTTHHSHTTTHTYNNTHTSVSSLSSREQSVAPATTTHHSHTTTHTYNNTYLWIRHRTDDIHIRSKLK